MKARYLFPNCLYGKPSEIDIVAGVDCTINVIKGITQVNLVSALAASVNFVNRQFRQFASWFGGLLIGGWLD